MNVKTKKRALSVDKVIKSGIWYTFKYVGYALMVVWALSFVAVILWTLMNSLKTGRDYTEDVFRLPTTWDWSNYVEVFTKIEFKGYTVLGMLGNSLILVAINVASMMLFQPMAAYVIAKVDFKGKKILEDIIYASMIVPVVGTTAATLNFMISSGLYNTWLGVFFLGSAAFGFNQMLLTSFYRGMENAYAEAAYIDGASNWVVFTKIYYPQGLPIMYPLIITTVIAVWNDFLTGYLYLPSHPTIALGLQQMQRTFVTYGNDYPLLFAGIIIMLIPILIIFACFSDKMLNNKNLGALK